MVIKDKTWFVNKIGNASIVHIYFYNVFVMLFNAASAIFQLIHYQWQFRKHNRPLWQTFYSYLRIGLMRNMFHGRLFKPFEALISIFEKSQIHSKWFILKSLQILWDIVSTLDVLRQTQFEFDTKTFSTCHYTDCITTLKPIGVMEFLWFDWF